MPWLGSHASARRGASRLSRGKKLVFIQTQEAGGESFREVFERYSMFFQFYGFSEIKLIWGHGIGQTSEMNQHTDILREAQAVAQDFCAA